MYTYKTEIVIGQGSERETKIALTLEADSELPDLTGILQQFEDQLMTEISAQQQAKSGRTLGLHRGLFVMRNDFDDEMNPDDWFDGDDPL